MDFCIIHAAAGRIAPFVGVLFSVLAVSARADERLADPDHAPPPRRIGEFGLSHWGPIPPPERATPVSLTERGKPTWARVVDFPYSVAFFPIKMLGFGVEESAEYVTEHDFLGNLVRLFPLRIGNTSISPGASFDSQDGTGGSLSIDTVDFLTPEGLLKFRGFSATKGKRKTTLGIAYPTSRSSEIEVGLGYLANQNTRFYGLGPDSEQDRESFFRQETSWGGVSYTGAVAATGLSWSVEAMASAVGAIGSDDSENPHLSSEFAGELPFGYRKRSDGRSLAFELRHDDTSVGGYPRTGRPERGGVRRARATFFESTGNNKGEFWTLRGELQQFVPLWFSKRALAFRGYLAMIEPTQGKVPFQRLMTNDDEDAFRGYLDERFRDNGITSVTIEYRWPAWVLENADGFGADCYLFVDSGQVFPEMDDIAVRDWKTSYGGGLRFAVTPFFLGRIELAKGDEGWQFRLTSEQIFQYSKRGLYHGRMPVPER